MISSFWLLPSFFEFLQKGVMPNYIFTYEVLDMLSRNATFTNVIRLISSWWPQVTWSSTSFINIWKILSVMGTSTFFSN